MGRAEGPEAEAARLRARVKLLEDTLEHMSHGLCAVDSEERLVLANRRYAEVLGIPPEKVHPGLSLEDIVAISKEAGAIDPEKPLETVISEIRASRDPRRPHRPKLRRGERVYDIAPSRAGRNVVIVFDDVTEKLQAEEALRDSEARLSAILEAMPDCVKIFDHEARLTYINASGLELVEAPDLKTLNASGHAPVLPEHMAQVIDVHNRVMAGETVVWTYEIVGMRGGRHHVEAHSVPFRMPDGAPAHMCISRDVSERVKAERALRRSERRLRLIQDSTGLADFETDTVGIKSTNGRFFEQVGIVPPREPMTFQQWLEHVHPEDREQLQSEVLRAMREEDSIDCEFRVVRADTGEVRWLATHTGVERDEAGELVGTIGAHLDITDRKRAEQALRDSEARLSAILDAMPDCVKLFDQTFELKYINPRGLELLEAPDLQSFNASGHVPLSPEYLPQCADVHARVIAGETVVWTYEIVGMKGARRHVEAHSVPFRMPDGAPAHMCISRDITERKRAEDALRRSEQRLRLVQEATGLAEFETGADGLMVASERFFQQLGLPATNEPVEGKAWAKQVHPADIDELVETVDTLVAQRGESFRGEFRIVRADTGEVRWISSNARIEYAGDGTPIRTIGAHVDITERKIAEEALRRSEQRLRLVQEATGLADFESGPDGIAHVSESMVEQMGLPPGTATVTLEELIGYVHREDRDLVRKEIERSLVADDDTFRCEFRIVRPDNGEVRWVYSRTKMERDADGKTIRTIGAHLDITERKRAEDALRESEERFRLAAEAAGLGIWDYDTTLERRDWSIRLREIFGVPPDAVPSFELAAECVHKDDRADFMRQLNEIRVGNIARFEASYRINRADDGRERWVTFIGWSARETDGTTQRIIITVRDVTDEKTAEERVRWSASHDPLTRLANRALFREKLDQAISGAKQRGEAAGVVMLDLDHFKQVNDSLGHDVGDALLKMFAERLRSVVRSRDTVARLGGDEFAIVVPRLQSKDELLRLSRLIQERMRAPFVHGGRVLDCRVSSGASVYPDHARSSKDILKCADTALYAAKAAGRATVTMYEPHMREDLQRRVSMVELARKAIEDDRVIPYYQPKLDLQTGRVDGFEALLRWRNSKGRICHPGALEAAFEDLEVAAAISDRMIDRVIGDMRVWLDRGVAFRHVAVNASAAEFRRDNFAERVLDRLRRADIPTRCFQLEVTETVFLGRGAEYVHRALALLNQQGVKIALDDFGTGYASLRHLKQFPVDIIKIDQSFVRDMEVDPNDEAIVRAVINLGKSLGIAVVAEGIESMPQAERLQRLGCDFGQGFLFSKAIAASRVPPLTGKWQDEDSAPLPRAKGQELRLVASRD